MTSVTLQDDEGGKEWKKKDRGKFILFIMLFYIIKQT